METRCDVVAVWREEVRKGFQAREDFWLGRLKVRGLDKVAVIFVCGADHVDTFKATLGANGIQACIHCRDWPNDMSVSWSERERSALLPRKGVRPYTMTPAKLRLAQAAMAKRDTKVGELCKELGVTRQTLYRFVNPKGELRAEGRKLLERRWSLALTRAVPPAGWG
jgi:hypothetical protein